MPFAKIYIVRHGETQSNKESIIQGQLDTELNETGIEQARRVADVLRCVHFDAAYSSDLVRALKVRAVPCPWSTCLLNGSGFNCCDRRPRLSWTIAQT